MNAFGKELELRPSELTVYPRSLKADSENLAELLRPADANYVDDFIYSLTGIAVESQDDNTLVHAKGYSFLSSEYDNVRLLSQQDNPERRGLRQYRLRRRYFDQDVSYELKLHENYDDQWFIGEYEFSRDKLNGASAKRKAAKFIKGKTQVSLMRDAFSSEHSSIICFEGGPWRTEMRDPHSVSYLELRNFKHIFAHDREVPGIGQSTSKYHARTTNTDRIG